jgi:triosephosphate isomerase
MRKQIAAANWKMNLTLTEGEALLDAISARPHSLAPNQEAIFAVPFPYISMAQAKVGAKNNVFVAAQNCSNKLSGAFTGEVSVTMLQSMCVKYVVIGHSERREYFNESNELLAQKVDICLENKTTPIFCCGEPLEIRESATQNVYVSKQLTESLFHLSEEAIAHVVIAYEPIWAIGTGKTASSEQAQEMHAYIRSHIASKYGQSIADSISILYGGSVKSANAVEIFSQPDVDGGLVGGASLIVDEFVAIINALKK